MATLTLNSNNLPDPQVYKTSTFYRGAATVMADGTIRRDLVDSSAKRRFTLQWVAVTDANKTTLETAFADLDNGSQTFTDHGSTSYTVTRADDQDELEFEHVPTANGNRWNTNTLVLIEA
jgi:hypothetical protein